MRRFFTIITLLLATTMLYGRGKGEPQPQTEVQSPWFEGDKVAPSGDTLRVARAVILTTDGIKRRDIHNDPAGARKLFEEALKVDPTYTPAKFYLASLLSSTPEDSKAAAEYAKMAYLDDSLNKWYVEQYAQKLIGTMNLAESSAIYAKLIKITPNDPNPYRVRALVLQYNNQPNEALEVLESALSRFGNISAFVSHKNDILLATKQTDKAIEEARKLVEEEPYSISHRVMLAKTYSATGQDSLAVAEYNGALRINSKAVEALIPLADFYKKGGNTAAYLVTMDRIFQVEGFSIDEKIKIFTEIIATRNIITNFTLQVEGLVHTLAEQYPKDEQVFKMQTEFLIASGKLDDAIELYKARTQERPADIEKFIWVIDVEEYKERRDSTDLYLSKALKLFKENSEIYITKARIEQMREDIDAAIGSYNKALEYEKSDSLKSQIWEMIGNAEYSAKLQSDDPKVRKNRQNRCYKAYDNALKLVPDNAGVLNNYAYFLSEEENGDLNRAMLMSKRSNELVEKSSTYLDTYAWILYKMGDYEEAKKFMRQAISFDTTKSAELPLHYGDILEKLGEDFLAEVYWQKAKELGYPAEEIDARIKRLKEAAQ
ncbi:MAG: tetratricopeptide repeat protein [Rikenellaceae bacterium]